MQTEYHFELDKIVESLQNLFAKVSTKEHEITQLKSDFSKRESKYEKLIQQLQSTITNLETDIQKADNRVSEMTRTIQHLTSFKMNVVGAFGEEKDLNQVRSSLTSLNVNVPKEHEEYQTPSSISPSKEIRSRQSSASPTRSPKQTSFSRNSSTVFLSSPRIQDGEVDAKDFFKHARSLLSSENFTNLINTVKGYNERSFTRAKTIEVVCELFKGEPKMVEAFEYIIGA